MKKRFHSFLFSVLLLPALASAQFTVSGTVKDSATNEPLSGASVFCQNTTLGTATNKQGEYSLGLKSGGYDLIFSYTGYQTQTIRVTDNNRIEVLLVKEEKSLGEVVLRNSNEVTDGLSKYGEFFLSHFIGTTPNAQNCTVQNPEVLKFFYYKRSNKLKVLAEQPLLVSNKALGYEMRYQLDSFVYYYNTDIDTYRGYCLYSEMEGSDSLKKVWTNNRKKAFTGSKLHFLRSYYDSTLTDDGWVIDMLDENDAQKFVRVKDPYDTLYYGSPDSTGEVNVWFPRKFSVTYTKKKPEPEYLKKYGMPKNVSTQITYVDLRDEIFIKVNGYFYDQKAWVNQGYWSWKNLADQLPYDYEPD